MVTVAFFLLFLLVLPGHHGKYYNCEDGAVAVCHAFFIYEYYIMKNLHHVIPWSNNEYSEIGHFFLFKMMYYLFHIIVDSKQAGSMTGIGVK